jgi:hypothetical protein
VSYGVCGLPYFLKGEIPRVEDLIARTPRQFAEQSIQVVDRRRNTPGRIARDLQQECNLGRLLPIAGLQSSQIFPRTAPPR